MIPSNSSPICRKCGKPESEHYRCSGYDHAHCVIPGRAFASGPLMPTFEPLAPEAAPTEPTEPEGLHNAPYPAPKELADWEKPNWTRVVPGEAAPKYHFKEIAPLTGAFIRVPGEAPTKEKFDYRETCVMCGETRKGTFGDSAVHDCPTAGKLSLEVVHMTHALFDASHCDHFCCGKSDLVCKAESVVRYLKENSAPGEAEVRETREQKCECCGCPLGACIHDDCSECGGNFKASKYWQSRAETAELKVLTFHEEIVKLGQEWQSRVDQAESQVRELTALKDEIDQMRFAAECEVDQQDKEIAELTESRDKLKTEVMLNVAVQLREIGVTADVEGNFVNQESERLRSTVDRLEGELKEAQRQSQLGWADVKELQRILTFIASPENWYDDCGEWEWLPKKPNGGGMKSMSNPTLDELASLRARNSELVEGLKKLAAIWQEDSDERTRLGLLGDATLAECVLDLESLLATQKEKENVAPSKT